MPGQRLAASVMLAGALLLGAPAALHAQYAISLTAGGGPNGLPATSSSIGFAGGVAKDASGNTYVADVNSSRIYKISSTGTLTVFAGNESGIGGEGGYSGDGGPATSAQLGRPEGVAVDASGNVFIADTDNSVIREVSAASGNITTVAGVAYSANQACSYGGDGGPATSAQLCRPAGVFVDGSGNIFIADTENSVIREVVEATGTIRTVAGDNALGAGYSGNGGAATSAQLDLPFGVFVDASGNIFIADTFNSVIREVAAATGIIQTVAGTQYAFSTCTYSGDGGAATTAFLCLPNAVALDSSGNIFIADTENSAIREVVAATGAIQTVAGSATLGAGYSGDGGLATSAQLNLPSALFLDSSDDIFIADTDNFVLREVTAATGDISTIAGNNTVAYSGDGGPATNASLNAPGGVFVDGAGNIFIADTLNNAVREIPAGSANIVTVAGTGAAGFAGDGAAATGAKLHHPSGVFVDAGEDIFIADTGNSAVRCVVGTSGGCFGSSLAVGSIVTIAGTGTAGSTGDGGPASAAQLSNPFGVFVDSGGNLFIADTDNSKVRCVVGALGGCFASPLAVGSITTVAGTGTTCQPPSGSCGDGSAATSAQLSFPAGVSGDSQGDLFIADTFDSKIREVVAATGNIQTVVGNGITGYSGDGGLASAAQLFTPYGVFVDPLGNLFIADTFNNVVREVVSVTGLIQTIAGNNTPGYSGDGGAATNAQLFHPLSLAGDSSGNLFVADSENSRIRKLVSIVSVSVLPTSATLPTGGTQQLLATVTGSTDTTVTWQVNGVTGGNATVGTISTLGLYQAPAAVPTPATVTVTAIANANGATSASAQFTIVLGSGTATVTVSTSPSVSEVYTNATQTFTANVTDSTNPAVNWEVNGVLGGNTTVGTITSGGVYTAPASVPSPAVVSIEAVLQANPAVSGSYPLQIAAAPVAPAPAPQTVSAGTSAVYAIALTANTGDPSQPITLSCLASSLPAGATCSFSPPTITPGTSAVPFNLTVNSTACVAALQSPKNGIPASGTSLFFLPAVGILLTGMDKRGRRLWRRILVPMLLCAPVLLWVGCGSSGGSKPVAACTQAGTYQIVVQGTTKAQPKPVNIVTITLTVR